MSVCIGFPYHIQPEVKMHFNILLFSIHKAVITLQVGVVGGGGVGWGGGGCGGGWRRGYNKHCLLTLLV